MFNGKRREGIIKLQFVYEIVKKIANSRKYIHMK
jgi:hypothetical protein